MEDHIHLLLQIPPTLTLAKAVLAVKSNSSRWIKQRVHEFAWQEGYGAFSVSKSNIAAVVRYIQDQEKHHKRISFEKECVALLKKHGGEFYPNYVLGLSAQQRRSDSPPPTRTTPT